MESLLLYFPPPFFLKGLKTFVHCLHLVELTRYFLKKNGFDSSFPLVF